jgi:starvation-inducible DNA-binding protein
MTDNNSSLLAALKCLYTDNFVTYYKSHGFHFNIQGTTFSQDHGLLEEIYNFLWEQHDMLGEQIRQFDLPVLPSLRAVLTTTEVNESTTTTTGTQKSIFSELLPDLELLMKNGQYVYDSADKNYCGGLATLIGDYLKGVSKLRWKVKATLGRSMP